MWRPKSWRCIWSFMLSCVASHCQSVNSHADEKVRSAAHVLETVLDLPSGCHLCRETAGPIRECIMESEAVGRVLSCCGLGAVGGDDAERGILVPVSACRPGSVLNATLP